MAQLILTLFFASLIGVLTYIFLREEKRLVQLQSESAEMIAELHRYRETEQHLRNELTNKQSELVSVSKDTVTHLTGWKVFEDRLNQGIKESERYQLSMGILFVDIDDFEIINEALGYHIGDALLQEVAKRLEACVRQVDNICRYNKDTFIIMLTQLGKPETAAIVAQRILQSLAQSFQIQEHEMFITVGVGIAIYPTDGQDAASLCGSAERALRMAKEKGKNLYQFAQEKLFINSQRDLVLTNSLRREFSPQEFVTYYQPVMNMADGTVYCMDAQLQWQHPQLGLVSSSELFASATKQGKLNVICEQLLRNACKQFLHWQSRGFQPRYIGMPLVVKQLENAHFIYRISQILQELKFNPECLLLELKEISSLSSFEALEKSINMLKYLKVKLLMDDFGSDPFSLRNLKHVEANYLRLDSLFINDAATNSHTRALIKSIAFLAENTGLKLIAQGVDSAEQAQALREQGCLLMQGKFTGAPLSENEVVEKMAETV